MDARFKLTPTQIEDLRKVVYPFCADTDVEQALNRYPGKLGRNDCFPNSYNLNTLTQACLTQVVLENGDYGQSFMLRLIEQKWPAEDLRRGVVGTLPALVRPPRGFDAQIAALTAALDALTQHLPAEPQPGNIGDAVVFKRFCAYRPDIDAMVASLTRYATLKDAHDALHKLQVLGAGWLDAFSPAGGASPAAAADAQSVGPLLTFLARIAQATSVDTGGLSVGATTSFANCSMTAQDASRRLQTGNPDEIAFACATLRALLIRELPAIDGELFAVSREFPLRALCALFVSDPPDATLQAALLAAVDLADMLRRRLMEHGLWQAADLSIYALEHLLAQPSPVLVSSMQKLVPWLLRNLRVLLDSRADGDVVSAMEDAVLRYAMATEPARPSAIAADSAAALATVKTTFMELRRYARSSFLDVDQAMLADFSRLLKLQASLRAVLDRVPPHCDYLIPL